MPGVVLDVQVQQGGGVFSQHACLFSGASELVPAQVQLLEPAQAPEPLQSHDAVVARVHKL